MNRKLIALYFLGQVLSIAAAGVVLLWSAGRIDWWAAWAVIGVWVAWFAAMDIVILRFNPGLMAERLLPPQGAKTWDRAILSILRLTELVRYILAGLDQRYGWTGSFPLAAQIAALIVCALASALFTWLWPLTPSSRRSFAYNPTVDTLSLPLAHTAMCVIQVTSA
jgi:hypothetical protein